MSIIPIGHLTAGDCRALSNNIPGISPRVKSWRRSKVVGRFRPRPRPRSRSSDR